MENRRRASPTGGVFFYLCIKISVMYIKNFYNDIFIPLIIVVGMPYEDMKKRFYNAEKSFAGKWGSEEDYYIEAASVNLVKDLEDGDVYKILLNFRRKEDMSMRNITHECFHIAVSMASFHNMSMGFNIGEDEHLAHIAGWGGLCCGEVWTDLEKEEKESGKEEEK